MPAHLHDTANDELLTSPTHLVEDWWNLTTTDIGANEWVVRDMTGYAATAARQAYAAGTTAKRGTAAGNEPCIGVAIDGIAAGACGKVVRRGLTNARVPASSSVGWLLKTAASGESDRYNEATAAVQCVGIQCEANVEVTTQTRLVDVRCA